MPACVGCLSFLPFLAWANSCEKHLSKKWIKKYRFFATCWPSPKGSWERKTWNQCARGRGEETPARNGGIVWWSCVLNNSPLPFALKCLLVSDAWAFSHSLPGPIVARSTYLSLQASSLRDCLWVSGSSLPKTLLAVGYTYLYGLQTR